MQPSAHLSETMASTGETGTILTHRTLVDADGFCEALLSDIESAGLDDAYRGLGLTDVSFWVQRDPDAGVVQWEGADIDTLLERFAASSNPVLAKWRGLLRVFSGPEEADSFWDASRDRLLCWSTGEQGAESEITIFREPRQVDEYRRLANDFQRDPMLFGLLDRVRRRQGFTRIETWHQVKNGNDVVLGLTEANDLKDAMAQIGAQDNELDRRTVEIVRTMLHHPSLPPSTAKLIARWNA